MLNSATPFYIIKKLATLIVITITLVGCSFYGFARTFSDSSTEALGYFPALLGNTTAQEKQDAVILKQEVANGEVIFYHGGLYDSAGVREECLTISYIELTRKGWLPSGGGAFICDYSKSELNRVGAQGVFFNDMKKREQRTAVAYGKGHINDIIEIVWEDESSSKQTLTDSEYFLFVNELGVYPKQILFWGNETIQHEINIK